MEEKKKNAGHTFLIVLLVLALIGTSGYIVYDKFIVKESKQESQVVKKDDEDEEKTDIMVLEVTDSEVRDVFKKISTGLTAYCGVNDYYKNVKVTSNDISNDLAFNIAVLQIYNDKVAQGIQSPFSAVGDAFTATEVETKIASTFGKDYKFTHKTFELCPTFSYDATNNKYVIPAAPGCGGTCGPSNLKKIVKAIKNDKIMELYVRVLFAGGASETDYYKDFNKTQKVGGLETNWNTGFATDSDANVAKGSLYKMIFEKEDNAYVFVSSELVSG